MQRAILLLLVFVAGCSFGDDKVSINSTDLSKLVLQPADLPSVFVRFDEGRQLGADSPGGRRADPGRFGRENGWRARYRRPDSANAAGPLVVDSRADVFASAGGAEEELDAARADLADSEGAWKPIDEPGLGDESFAATFVQPGLSRVRFYEVFWRDGNATASLSVNGFEGKLALADVLELARKQQRRMSAAATS